jgi:hypothetical protein
VSAHLGPDENTSLIEPSTCIRSGVDERVSDLHEATLETLWNLSPDFSNWVALTSEKTTNYFNRERPET